MLDCALPGSSEMGRRARTRVGVGATFATGSLVALWACGPTPSSGSCTDTLSCAPDASVADASVNTGDAGALDATVDASNDAGVGEAAATEEASVGDSGLDAADGFDGFTCDPLQVPHDEACVIADAVGVFVAPAQNGGSDTAGDGSRAKPYATVAQALSNRKGKSRVYLCNATYAGGVTVDAATGLYGGLLCPTGAVADWTYSPGGQATVAAAVNQIALTVQSVSGAVDIEDLVFVAPDASGQDDAGNGLSSLAVLVDNAASVTFRRCSFRAGNGADGADGGTPSNYVGATAPSGQPADDAGNGGAGGTITCADGTLSFGGHGGFGGTTAGTAGADGGAAPLPIVTLGFNGLGGGAGGISCGTGADPGANGASGGAAVAAPSLGIVTGTGWTPSAGGAGGNGQPGQGGGGGGGQEDLGGTGGGAGGCGGSGGAGGGGGGASLALACVDSGVTLDTCILAAGMGGTGGRGGNGQPGQNGGTFGAASALGNCAGGIGGNGAGGSGGGGGAGGLSACIVYRGAAPSGGFTCTPGVAGAAGAGGAGQAAGTNRFGNGSPGIDGGAGLPGQATMEVNSP
jgi:hypothetical protein